MKVIVFGPTGGTGIEVVKQLLGEGQEVTAYARNPEKIKIKDSKLKIIHGDVFDETHVAHAIKDHDAVISCLGSNTLKVSNQITMMVTNIVNGMVKSDVNRLAVVATAGIENEIKGPMGIFVKVVIGQVINDHKNAMGIVKSSGVNYTIARPVQLKDAPLSKKYFTALEGLPKEKKAISRANVAHFLVQSVINQEYINASVGLAEGSEK